MQTAKECYKYEDMRLCFDVHGFLKNTIDFEAFDLVLTFSKVCLNLTKIMFYRYSQWRQQNTSLTEIEATHPANSVNGSATHDPMIDRPVHVNDIISDIQDT